MAFSEEIEVLADQIKNSQKMLTALGDPTRQHLILVMIQSGCCKGMRVMEIAGQTNLSRPAVSHHLKILKEAGIVKMRREGTKNYYYFDADRQPFCQLIDMLRHAEQIMRRLPDRSGCEEENE